VRYSALRCFRPSYAGSADAVLQWSERTVSNGMLWSAVHTCSLDAVVKMPLLKRAMELMTAQSTDHAHLAQKRVRTA
jgi:hypothetical protein